MVTARVVRVMVIGIISSSCVLFAAEQFVAKKAAKAPSLGNAKQECCEQLVVGMKLVPNLLSQVALFQQKAISIVEGYWQSDKESFCQVAAKEKLVSCNAQLKQLNEKTAELLAQYKKVLNELAE